MPLENVTIVLLSEFSKCIHSQHKLFLLLSFESSFEFYACVSFTRVTEMHVTHSHVLLLAWLSSSGSGLWLYGDIQKVEKVIVGTVYLLLSLRRGAVPPLPRICLRVLYRDSLTCLLFYGNGQWANHCAPPLTIQAVEKINYGHVLKVYLSWRSAQATTDGSGFGSRQGYGMCLYSKLFRPALGPIQPLIQFLSGLFPRRLNGRDVKLTTYLHLVPRLGMHADGSQLPPSQVP